MSLSLSEWGLLLAAYGSAGLAILPAAMTWNNLSVYTPAPPADSDADAAARLPKASVLIPARNEEGAIGAALAAVLASRGVDFEVVVCDDDSADRTAEIVLEAAAADSRARLVRGEGLPTGWNGKQHACWRLAQAAREESRVLVFLDADVRLEPDGLARALRRMQELQADLLSGVPRQVTGTLLEKMLIPLIQFVLLGYLPMAMMRARRDPAFAAGCGQFFLADRAAYFAAGGHSAIRDTGHDGLRLPKAFRAAGRSTDLVDATDLASCRMYRSASEVWKGLLKNAHEGLGAPGVILPMTLLLGGGQVFPWVLLAASLGGFAPAWLLAPAAVGAAAGLGVRSFQAYRFRLSPLGALLHPVGVFLLLVIQWQAFFARWLGRPTSWKGRSYAAEAPHVG